MEGKLIKTENGYGLKDCELIAFVSSRRPEHKHHKLSLTNCQAIERGYDLDELLKKEIANGKLHPNDGAKKEGIERGIQIALEIFGDKKFSGEDLMEAYSRGQTNSPIQSLQLVEWDVEIEMEKIILPFGANQFYNDYKPKLEDGYIILKRI